MKINWEAVGAIGTVAAACATYWAVVTSLRNSKPKLKLSVMKNATLSQGHFMTGNRIVDDVIVITVVNSGYMPITIESIGYVHRNITCMINPDPRLFNSLPIKIEPSEKASVWTETPKNLSWYLDIRDVLYAADSLGNMYLSKTNIVKRIYRMIWRKMKSLKP